MSMKSTYEIKKSIQTVHTEYSKIYMCNMHGLLAHVCDIHSTQNDNDIIVTNSNIRKKGGMYVYSIYVHSYTWKKIYIFIFLHKFPHGLDGKGISILDSKARRILY